MGVFDKAKRKIQARERLNKLKKDLIGLGQYPVPHVVKGHFDYSKGFEYTLRFFNIIASFQDQGPMYAEDFKDAKAMNEFQKHINNAGRDMHGFVRAKKGEKVTYNNLYLGNVYGLFTHPAKYWAESKDQEAQDIINEQMSNFIKSHIGPMIECIDVLVEKNKPSLVQKVIAKKMQRTNG